MKSILLSTVLVLIIVLSVKAQNPSPAIPGQAAPVQNDLPRQGSSDPNRPIDPNLLVPNVTAPAQPENTSAVPLAPQAAPSEPDFTEGLSQRDPFRLPQYLLLRIKEKQLTEKSTTAVIDDSVNPAHRWPLNAYQLVGILWDVKRPKAMFIDQNNSIHMVQLNDKLGNGGGVISSINNGEVVVIENKVPLRIKLKK